MKWYTVNNISEILQLSNCTTRNGYELTYKNVWQGVETMNTKHSACNWLEYDYIHPLINDEGLFWLKDVYFNHTTSQINLDIKYFENIIEDYKQVCVNEKIKYDIVELISDDMTFYEMANLFSRNINTVKKYFYKLPPKQKINTYYRSGKRYVVSEVCDELCRMYFKETYISYLELLYINMKKSLTMQGVEINYGTS